MNHHIAGVPSRFSGDEVSIPGRYGHCSRSSQGRVIAAGVRKFRKICKCCRLICTVYRAADSANLGVIVGLKDLCMIGAR